MTIEDQPGFDPRLAWASEGGTLLALVCAGAVVLAGCLRNASAVAVAAPDLPAALSTCVSGRELAGQPDLAADVRLAAEHDVSQTVPRLSGGAFAQLS